ncbi:MAG: hypothetical protein FRX49_05537 [Trebouxia sp. A1-2]|nr:MAG: hypothetical protein FRX49_05537 [Trebouxia sp. A1-2]
MKAQAAAAHAALAAVLDSFNKRNKGSAPSTQHKAPTLADQKPALLSELKFHRNLPAPIPLALAKHPKARRTSHFFEVSLLRVMNICPSHPKKNTKGDCATAVPSASAAVFHPSLILRAAG